MLLRKALVEHAEIEVALASSEALSLFKLTNTRSWSVQLLRR